MTAYLGCYTDEAHANGLKVLELDERSGAMSVVAERPVSNAIYQALSPDGKYLYSCTGEGLASFRAERAQRTQSHLCVFVSALKIQIKIRAALPPLFASLPTCVESSSRTAARIRSWS